jgi:alkylation response protein AidB-like acyl-CoA dehydrogenase
MPRLSEEQRLVVDTVRQMVKREVAPRARELDEHGHFPEHAHRLLAEAGLLNPVLPAAYGGSPVSLLTFAVILEEIAAACASTALLLIAQADGTLPILEDGSEALRAKYLPRLGGTSPLLTAFAATEPSAGSDLLSMQTQATRRGNVYVLRGRKCFITNGCKADLLVVYAYTERSQGSRGLSAFVVERGTPGLAYGKNEDKMGMRGSPSSELFFDDLEVPAENLIGREGGGYANLMKALGKNRLFCAAQAVGIARGAYQEAVKHARTRVQFGKPIAELAPIQFMVSDMAAAIESARLLTHKAAELFDDGDPRQGALYGGLAKVLASDNALRVTTDAVQIMGGYGYLRDYGVERMMRDAKLTQIYTGTNQVTRMVSGRALLRE